MADFKSALLTLPDEAFFELVRNYLGPIKTPFNKHDLIDRVERLLRQEETQTRIVRLIDTDDAQLLSAIWLLGEPPVDDIFGFFSGRRSYMDTHHQLLNMEDRLLIYRDGERLRLNEILKPTLEDEILSPALLFKSRQLQLEEQSDDEAWLSDTLLLSFLSFCMDETEFFRADGQLRKRVSNQLTQMIPVVSEKAFPDNSESSSRATELLRALGGLGLVDSAAGTVAPPEIWEPFAVATPTRRVALLAAGWTIASGSEHNGRGLGRTVVPLAEVIEAVISTLNKDVAVDPDSMEQLVASVLPSNSAGSVRRIREAMTLFGLLHRLSDDFLVPCLPAVTADDAPVVIQPNFEVTVPATIDFDRGTAIARLARLVQHDRYPRFELTKERLAVALRDGMELDEALVQLSALSRNSVPQNVTVSLKSWGAEYESIRLFKGVVLTIEESRRYLAEQPALATSIQRELCPGVYLIAESDVAIVQEALAETGVDLIPELSTASSLGQPQLLREGIAVDRERLAGFARLLGRPQTERTLRTDGSRLLDELHSSLEEQSMTADLRQEIAARIDRKLILSSEQISSGSLKAEKTEARGLDYVGKVRVIENALRSGTSFLEVVERADDGAPIRRLLEPTELQKESDELYLVALELPSREQVQVRVRKLGLVRRIRGGLVSRRVGDR